MASTDIRFIVQQIQLDQYKNKIISFISLTKMLSSFPSEFYQICQKMSNSIIFDEVMHKQQQFFQIQTFKVDKLYSQNAKKIYNQLKFKYEIIHEYKPNPTFWYENQRKLFIWFVVCYFYLKGISPQNYNNVNWKTFSDVFFGKDQQFLTFQFLNIVKDKVRISWNPEEDEMLIKSIQTQGSGAWNQISKSIFFGSNGKIFKTPKHCRQRWLNHLNPNMNKGRWTYQQDLKLLRYVKINGKKWSKISALLNNTRTQHMVKNRYNSLISKAKKSKKQRQTETFAQLLKELNEKNLRSLSQQEKIQNNANIQIKRKSLQESQKVNSLKNNSQYIQNQKEQNKPGKQIQNSKYIQVSRNFSNDNLFPGLIQFNYPTIDQSMQHFPYNWFGCMFFLNNQQNQWYSSSCINYGLENCQKSDEKEILRQKVQPVYIVQHRIKQQLV